MDFVQFGFLAIYVAMGAIMLLSSMPELQIERAHDSMRHIILGYSTVVVVFVGAIVWLMGDIRGLYVAVTTILAYIYTYVIDIKVDEKTNETQSGYDVEPSETKT